jgi:hypothetical protein
MTGHGRPPTDQNRTTPRRTPVKAFITFTGGEEKLIVPRTPGSHLPVRG